MFDGRHAMTVDESETFVKCGEIHFVWPHSYNGGNHSRCDDCRYFVVIQKNKELIYYGFDGECHSKAHQTERGYSHRKKGWDKTRSNSYCHWWFPIGKVAGEQEELYGQKEERDRTL